VASAEEAGELLAALPADLRALYAGAFYAGLRRGELRAIRWEDVDVAGGVITVRRGWDDVVGEIALTPGKGFRTVPVIALLRDYLVESREREGREERDFVFGASGDRPFAPSRVGRSAARAWSEENAARSGRGEEPLVPIRLHDCRHTFVLLMYDAGLSLERIGDYIGHSPAYMIDRYRHLLEGDEAEMRRIMDDYLARADGRREADSERGSDVPI
jgi:integrase